MHHVSTMSPRGALGSRHLHSVVAILAVIHAAASPATAAVGLHARGHTDGIHRTLPRQQPPGEIVPTRGDAAVSAGGEGGSQALVDVAARACKIPSTCVPPDTVVLTWASHQHLPLLGSQIRNVQHEECLMSRFVIVALDLRVKDHCELLKHGGLQVHCALALVSPPMLPRTTGDANAAMTRAMNHHAERWQAISALVSSGTNVWAFDADVAVLQLPPLVELSTKRSQAGGLCDVLHQRQTPQLPAVTAVGGGDTAGGTMGQAFYRAHSDAVLQMLTTAAAAERAGITLAEDQPWSVTGGMSFEGVKVCDLPDEFASSCWGMPQGAVTFHASCVDGVRPKGDMNSVQDKVRVLHTAIDDLGRIRRAAASTTPAAAVPAGFTCWRNGVKCVTEDSASEAGDQGIIAREQGPEVAVAPLPVPTPALAPPPSDENAHCEKIKDWPRSDEEWVHVVWLGDSLTRYQYLQLVYQVDRDGPGDDGDFLLNEKKFDSWTDFLNQTSESLFSGQPGGGRMTCDCWRDEAGGRGDIGHSRVDMFKENRYYYKRRQGQKNIALSFYWWPGDLPLQGSVDVGEECNAVLVSATNPPPQHKWQTQNTEDFFSEVLSKLVPRPTHIVLNNGLWNPTVVMQKIGTIIKAANIVTPGRVYWKETSPLVGEFPRRPHDIDGKARDACGAKGRGLCTYIPFPDFPKRLKNGSELRRWDSMHFADVATYKCWTRAVLEAMGNLEDVLPASQTLSGREPGDELNTCSLIGTSERIGRG